MKDDSLQILFGMVRWCAVCNEENFMVTALNQCKQNIKAILKLILFFRKIVCQFPEFTDWIQGVQ